MEIYLNKYDLQYAARDKDGDLYMYSEPPTKDLEEKQWVSQQGSIAICLDERLLPEISWEDEEPTEVELVIKK